MLYFKWCDFKVCKFGENFLLCVFCYDHEILKIVIILCFIVKKKIKNIVCLCVAMVRTLVVYEKKEAKPIHGKYKLRYF